MRARSRSRSSSGTRLSCSASRYGSPRTSPSSTDTCNSSADPVSADIVSALTYSIIRAHGGAEFSPAHNRVVGFVLAQSLRAPDYLRLPLRLATRLFDLSAVLATGHRFHRLRPERRQR